MGRIDARTNGGERREEKTSLLEFVSQIPPSFCLEETGRTKYQNERKRGARRRKKISLGLPLLIPALRKQIEQNSRTKEREEEEQKKILSRITTSHFCLEETDRTKYQNERKRGGRTKKILSRITASHSLLEETGRTRKNGRITLPGERFSSKTSALQGRAANQLLWGVRGRGWAAECGLRG